MYLTVKKKETSLYFCLYINYTNFKIYKNRTKRLTECDLEKTEKLVERAATKISQKEQLIKEK